MNIFKILCGVLALVLVGCSGAPVKLSTVEKPSAVDLNKGRKISATASGFQLLLFIPIGINSRMQSAYADLQAQAGDDLIADVKVTESWSYAFVGTIYRTTLDATAYPRNK